MKKQVSRRNFLQLSGLGLGGVLLTSATGCTAVEQGPDFTVAFLTDTHIDERRRAPEGLKQAISHLNNLPKPPDFIITGGDLAYDILEKDQEAADKQYELFFDAIKGFSRPIYHTVGNHDCLGVIAKSGINPDHPLYGKKYFLNKFNLDNTYYSFNHKNWHFVVLDSIQFNGRDYIGGIDQEQLEWLDADLGAANKPTVISMHIPLLTNGTEMEKGIEEPDHPKMVVENVHEVVKIIEKHPVKLVLGGHLHWNESYKFRGIEYANVGAVSARWWRGPRRGFEEGYALLEFTGDTVSWNYMDYGWEVLPEDMKG